MSEFSAYTVTVSNDSVVEGAGVQVNFSRDSTVGQLNLTVTTSHDTADQSDYTPLLPTTVTFEDGEATASVTINTTDDAVSTRIYHTHTHTHTHTLARKTGIVFNLTKKTGKGRINAYLIELESK